MCVWGRWRPERTFDVKAVRNGGAVPIRQPEIAVLSAKTFWTFMRESSPIGLPMGWAGEDTLAGRRWCLPGRVLIKHGFKHSESWHRGQCVGPAIFARLF